MPVLTCRTLLSARCRLTYGWIKEQIAKETGDVSKFSHSTIVKTSAPTELGGLRKADGAEGFEA